MFRAAKPKTVAFAKGMGSLYELIPVKHHAARVVVNRKPSVVALHGDWTVVGHDMARALEDYKRRTPK